MCISTDKASVSVQGPTKSAVSSLLDDFNLRIDALKEEASYLVGTEARIMGRIHKGSTPSLLQVSFSLSCSLDLRPSNANSVSLVDGSQVVVRMTLPNRST